MRDIQNLRRGNQNNQISRRLKKPNIKTSQKLKITTLQNIVLENYQKLECCICLHQIEQQGQSVQRILIQCNHHYHLSCLLEWINQNKNSCCICRQEVKKGTIFQPQNLCMDIAFIPTSQLIRSFLLQHIFINNLMVPIFLQSYYDRLNPLQIYLRLFPQIQNERFLILEKLPIKPSINQNVKSIVNQTNQARITKQRQPRRRSRMIKKRRLSLRLIKQKRRLSSQNRNGRNSLQLN